MYGIMTKISSVSSQNQLLMLKNAPEFGDGSEKVPRRTRGVRVTEEF